MVEDDDSDAGIAGVLAVAIVMFIALFAIGIALFLSGQPPLSGSAPAAPPVNATTASPTALR